MDPYGLQASGLPMDYAAEAQGLKGKRAIWEALLAQGMQPVQEQQTRGRFAIPNSPLQGIAQVLKAYLGAKGIKSSDDELKSILKNASASRDAIDRAPEWAGGVPEKAKPAMPMPDQGVPPQSPVGQAAAQMPAAPPISVDKVSEAIVRGADLSQPQGMPIPHEQAMRPEMSPGGEIQAPYSPSEPPAIKGPVPPITEIAAPPVETGAMAGKESQLPTRAGLMKVVNAISARTGRPAREIMASPQFVMAEKQIAEMEKPFNLNEGDVRMTGDQVIAKGPQKLTERQRNATLPTGSNQAEIDYLKGMQKKDLEPTGKDKSIPEGWEKSLPEGVTRSPNDPAGTFRMKGADGALDVYAAEFENGKITGYKKLDNAPKVSVTATANAGQKGDTKYAEERMKGRAESMAKLDAGAESAFKNMQALDRFLEASKKGTEGGAQPIISATQNFLSSFGIPASALKDVRQMEQALGQIQVNQIAEFGARGLTDNDMKVLRLALPKVETDKASRDLVANIVKKSYANQIAEWENQRAEEARVYPDLAGKIPEPAWYKQYKKMPSVSTTGAPQGVDPKIWEVMTPEERKLWQK